MKITPSLLEAYLKCPTKCWLRSVNELPTGNSYAEWVKAQNESYRAAETERLLAETPPGKSARSPSAENLKTAQWRVAAEVQVSAQISATVQAGRRVGPVAQASSPAGSGGILPPEVSGANAPGQAKLEASSPAGKMPALHATSCLHALERIPSEGRGKAAQFIPVRFIFTNKLSKDDKMLVAFDALVLSETLGREVRFGKIIHGDNHATLKVKTSALAGEVRKRLEKIAALLASPSPPELLLNRHCAECEFQARCRKIALEKDDLSLLAGMSAKERQKLRSKGIFTVTQLSYTFRPRRRPKRQRDKREKYHHSLKALAIREKKIHIVGSPELKIEGTPVYLDVEGLPDRDFYYRIGLRIGHGESAVQHSLWADTVAEEGKIWREFLGILETVEKPVLIHYGSYETNFLKQMRDRHGGPLEGSVAAIAIGSALNLISVMFTQIYLPSFSNGLKDVAGSLGYKWSERISSGLESIVSRCRWERSCDEVSKRHLLTYNVEDCEALSLAAEKVAVLVNCVAPSNNLQNQATDFVRADSSGLPAKSKWRTFTSPVAGFEAMNAAAHWDYQRSRV